MNVAFCINTSQPGSQKDLMEGAMKKMLFAGAALSALLCVGLGTTAQAAFIPTPANFFNLTSPGELMFTFAGFNAADTDTLKMVIGGQTIFINQSTPIGTSVTTGPLAVGSYPLELVDSSIPATWFSGPASGNTDNRVHLMSDTTFADFNLGAEPPGFAPGTVFYGWEDRAFPGADADFNDLVFTVTAVPVPEPSTIAILGLGLVALGGMMMRPRRRM
jgi:hypothetical protein